MIEITSSYRTRNAYAKAHAARGAFIRQMFRWW